MTERQLELTEEVGKDSKEILRGSRSYLKQLFIQIFPTCIVFFD